MASLHLLFINHFPLIISILLSFTLRVKRFYQISSGLTLLYAVRAYIFRRSEERSFQEIQRVGLAAACVRHTGCGRGIHKRFLLERIIKVWVPAA